MELLIEPPPQLDVDEEFSSMSEYAQNATLLYFRCRMFKELALPQQGGLEDQNELLMQMLEAAHRTYVSIQVQRNEQKARAIQSKANSKSGTNTHIGKKVSRRT